MRPPERAVGTAVLALVAVAALAGAWLLPWFEYDFSTGRQTPPGNAYDGGDDGSVHRGMTYTATAWSGDTAPDEGLASRLALLLPIGLGIAVAALLLAALGEVPVVHRVIGRRVALALLAVALAAIAATATMAWLWMPESMAAHGVDSPFTARLDEPDGYTSTKLLWGWYALAASALPTVGAGLLKYQAGAVDLEAVAALLSARREDA